MTIKVYDITEDFYWNNGLETSYLPVTDEEKVVIAKVIVAEAKDQPLGGKVGVASALLDRVALNGSSVIVEATKSGQFADISNVRDEEITDEIMQAVNMAIEKNYMKGVFKAIAEAEGLGKEYYETGVRYFYAPRWISETQLRYRKDIKLAVRYEDHVFYSYWDKQQDKERG